jgi:acyl carrier protein
MDEPGIEDALMSHPEVTDAATARVGGRPVALAVTTGFVSGPELRRHVRVKLGGAPDVVAIVPDIPRDGAGGPDLAALGERLAALPALYEFLPPRSAVQRWLADLWSALLGQPEIGIRDDFLELGGDSMSATTVLTEVHDAYQVTIPLADFFRLATIERLAAAIDGARGGAP